MASRPPVVVPRPPTPSRPQAARRVSGELTPPPADGYYDLVLDDPEPQDPKIPAADRFARPSSWPAEPETRAPPEAPAEARNLAPARKPASKRRLGAWALAAAAAGAVLFGAVGAMALRRPQREEERVSRALLPRAEWATSASSGAGPALPSADALEQFEDEEQPPAAGPTAHARPHDRARTKAGSRPVARPVPAARLEPAPAVQGAPAPAPALALAVPPPAASAPVAAPPTDRQTEDAPRFAREGFRSPAQVVPNCVQSSVRIPRDLQGFASGPVTVRFAVDKDGTVGLFRVEGQLSDPRISEALWSAVRGCRFLPGADDEGRPVRLWVVMPIRFVR